MGSHTHLRPPLRPPFRKLAHRQRDLGRLLQMRCPHLLSGPQHRCWLQVWRSVRCVYFSDIVFTIGITVDIYPDTSAFII